MSVRYVMPSVVFSAFQSCQQLADSSKDFSNWIMKMHLKTYELSLVIPFISFFHEFRTFQDMPDSLLYMQPVKNALVSRVCSYKVSWMNYSLMMVLLVQPFHLSLFLCISGHPLHR